MIRKTQHSSKLCQNDFKEIRSHEFESAPATKLNTEKLRKIKDFQNEIRCHSVRHPVREPKDKQDTGRTRSVSPSAHVPPLDAKLPLKKFYKLYSKIVVQLDIVKGFTETKTNESENLADLRRQLQRADEFSIRFSRNNLYETKRTINEIKQLIVPYPFEGLSPGNCRILCKKIILAFQAATQALQTYINYAKNPSNLEVPEKINELVLLIAELFLCCEHVSLPHNDAYIKHDAVKNCNELIELLKSKLPVYEYVEMKEADLARNRIKKPPEDMLKMHRLSMYRTKLTPKKLEAQNKKVGVPCLLGVRTKKKKKDETRAKITHEIYTQKLTPWQAKGLGNKIVKFEAENQGENAEEKKMNLRRPRYVTPREVRSQDDDVETMVQTIGDDEVSTCRFTSVSREIDHDHDGDDDDDLNKTNFKHLLLETIEELQNADKKEQKITLKKLLNSIQNCSKPPSETPRPDRVKVYHFLSKDLQEEIENTKKENEEKTEDKERASVVAVQEEVERHKKTVLGERRLNSMFRPVRGKDTGAEEGADVPRGRIKLKLSEEMMTNANKYRKAFAEYRKGNIMYKKTLANTPWELVGKVSDRIVLDIIEEISMDFENDALLRRLYLNELLEVTS